MKTLGQCLTGAAGPYVLAVLGAVLMTQTLVIVLQRSNLAAAHAQLHAAEVERDTARAVNQTLAATVRQIETENAKFAADCSVSAQASAQAGRALAAQAQAGRAAVEKSTRERSTIYEHDVDAARWASEPVPAAVAERLLH